MPKLSFGITGVGEEATGGFDNSPVKPGTYKGTCKYVKVSYIKKEGPNKGKPRLNIGVQVDSGPDEKAKGRMFWGGLNVIDGQQGWVNQFLNSLTDGSPAATKTIQKVFWNEDDDPKLGPDVDADGHILKVGKWKVGSPEGEIPIIFTLKKGKDQDGNPRSEVGRFLVKKSNGSAVDEDEDEEDPIEPDASSDDEEDEEPPF